jgi:hypothetical protein
MFFEVGPRPSAQARFSRFFAKMAFFSATRNAPKKIPLFSNQQAVLFTTPVILAKAQEVDRIFLKYSATKNISSIK